MISSCFKTALQNRRLLTMSVERASAERAAELATNYDNVLSKVQNMSQEHRVRLVAVSKLKPASDILALYDHGVRHFGENYVQEMISKAKELPKDIKWHFIGGLQTGKCKDLGKGIENLFAVETLDSLKKVRKLESARESAKLPPINVYLQINTSNEEQKAGYTLQNVDEIYETVEYLQQSKTLIFKGLMTIGSFAESTSDSGVNQDFSRLAALKKQLDEKFSLDLELSMGMSNDFEAAIEQGSTSVRVGTSIFGARPPRNGH
ncbi:YggS family pyridoxal phosphate enzyme [Candidozyma auris]|nr:YggS family pyridoxal phosphate enzyme [[Candida] auris]QEL58897.1 YggS family pyridoxal phosphate enzyme [[Candida] auris]